jgi:hypothetical protein
MINNGNPLKLTHKEHTGVPYRLTEKNICNIVFYVFICSFIDVQRIFNVRVGIRGLKNISTVRG